MQAEEWRDTRAPDDDEDNAAKSRSPEDLADHFGINLSLLIICVGLLIAAVWLVSNPSFEKCSAFDNATQRNACYGELRNDLMKTPAKGGVMPAG